MGDLAALAGWLAGLPEAVRTGDIPDQGELDAWAREHTLGLIDRFPLEVGPDTIMMLATALATRIFWEHPFDLTSADELGVASAWAGQVRNALATPDDHRHRQFIAVTERAGEVAVHMARAEPRESGDDRYGLEVTSLIAAAGVPPAEVLAAAHQVGSAIATGGQVARRRG